MAAIDHHPRAEARQGNGPAYLEASALSRRLEEEVHRCERHGSSLSCLLLRVENLDEIAHDHSGDLPEQTLDYIGAALARELRDFDRIGRPEGHDLLIVLPGTDEIHAEIVARRVLHRIRTIKIESQGQRRSLLVAVGLASWREDRGVTDLLERARAAVFGSSNGEDLARGPVPEPFAQWHPTRTQAQVQAGEADAGRSGRRAP